MRRFFALGLLLAAALGTACGDSPHRSGSSLRTIVLVTIDTWRRDANGFLGDPTSSPTPFLDAMAADGLVAVDAMAPVPLTGPSHWSILTGRWPWRDGVRSNAEPPQEVRGLTLAELLSARGWATAAFVSCSVLDDRFGFARGFATYDDRLVTSGAIGHIAMPERRGDRTVEAALAWLRQRPADEKIFLWLHLFDPHYPYAPPGPQRPGERVAYLGEVAFADAQVGTLAAGLEARGRPWRQALWVVLADHGEALGNHGERTHGLLLHGATTRIPFFLFGPGVPARRLPGLVTTVDVVPTVLTRLGLPSPSGDGHDLLSAPLGEDRPLPLESVYGLRAFGLPPAVGLRRGPWLWESSPRDHLWNLQSDPGEETDLAAVRPEVVAQLRRERARSGVPEIGPAPDLDPETERQLRALGYVSGGIAAESRDLWDFVREDAEWHFQLLTLQQQGDFDRAEGFVRRFLERNPRSPQVWVEAGFIAVRRGRMEEAESRFRRATELDQGDGQAFLNLGNVLLFGGRLEEAETAYRRVLEIDPEDYFALYNLGMILARQQRHPQAAAPWRRLLRLYPEHEKAREVAAALRQWRAAGEVPPGER